MEEIEEEKQLIWEASQSSSSLISESNSLVSATVGRVMNTLLTAKPKKLQLAISSLQPSPKIAPLAVSLEQSLWFLHKYVEDAREKNESLDQVLVPMIEHSLKIRAAKQSNQAIILLNWLFQDEILFQALAKNLAGIISRRDDHYIALGWCFLARSLLEFDSIMGKLTTNGIREKYDALKKTFCSCISHLLAIVCNGSTLQGGFELPTRLAVAAADVILSLLVSLTRKDLSSDFSDHKPKSFSPSKSNSSIMLLSSAVNEKKPNNTSKSSQSADMIMMFLLWDHLDELIILVEKLIAWNRKGRPLHAKGLEQVCRWLQETKKNYDCFPNDADSKMRKTGALLLSSCWKHYGLLLHLEDYKISGQYRELLQQYLSGIQYFAESRSEVPSENKESGIETLKFFINCLSLLLGRLVGTQFETAISEYGSQISQALISQLQSADDEVIEGATCILRVVIFKTNQRLTKSAETKEMDTSLPMLLHLLDERDGAAKVVIKLVAEYCSICLDIRCFQEVLKRLVTGTLSQRRNALDFISDIIHISSESDDALPQSMWQDIANHLLDFLQEEEVICKQASSLIPFIDPSLVLPSLVHLIYSPNERVQSSAGTAFISLLKNYKQNPEVVCTLIDCLSNLSQDMNLKMTGAVTKEGSQLDIERVLMLLPQWSKTVEHWDLLIGPLINKLFVEPSNAVIVRFLSFISEHLAEAAELVFQQLLSYTRRQEDFNEGFCTSNATAKRQLSIFSRLCPLLVIRLLPLRVFDNLDSSLMYGELPSKLATSDPEGFRMDTNECITALLIHRALNEFEFEDVRKLAAELCGRIHPKVLVPFISFQLENATDMKHLLKIKACLFAMCTSLRVRGMESYKHPEVFRIRKIMEIILLWPSMDDDEVSKAQHGCIDCLALMLCTELQAPKAFGKSISGDAGASSICNYVTQQLTCDEPDTLPLKLGTEEKETAHRSFRLCMANVLISACQKIPDSDKKALVSKILPRVIRSLKVITDSDIRSACIQVLFSMVYHLKSAVLPYSSDILEASIRSLREESDKERMGGAKLLASLMGSEEAVIQSISVGLLEARALLHSLSQSDPSLDVRSMSQKLLACLTSP
ncbi:PREDICTED: uncharacterized protein LOC109150918 isoform X2 [Ipomoea nil]|uniref:uncharacterized protein LOC109150918 isoform X2 n=1 Tax=Ipomoea nil TaxID=35883 RepID=UPI000901D439|nr:PREDICTED: uncharacterized protein LOC109150918 isoform X2 [Ipomoea nil]